MIRRKPLQDYGVPFQPPFLSDTISDKICVVKTLLVHVLMFYDFVTFNCSVQMSPHEGDGDIEQEGTKEANGIKSIGGG